MTKTEINRTLYKAISRYGKHAQVNMALVEMVELIAAINHFRRGRCTGGDVIEEIADVSIMMAQLAIIFGKWQYDSAVMRKMLLLREGLKE